MVCVPSLALRHAPSIIHHPYSVCLYPLWQRKAVYMQSSCRPYRDNYVKELMLHFPVDSLGSCVNNVGRNESPDAHGRKAYYKVSTPTVCSKHG